MVANKNVIDAPLELPPPPSAQDYERPPRELFRYLPDHTATLVH